LVATDHECERTRQAIATKGVRLTGHAPAGCTLGWLGPVRSSM
jgi:hypothetical protein